MQKTMNTKAITKCLGLTIFIAALAGCSTMEINTDFDPNANFAGLKTYAWLDEPREATGDPRIDDNPFLEGRVHAAVDRELGAKGFVMTSSGTPDFLVAYHVSLDKQRSVQHLNNYYGYGPGWGYTYAGAQRPGYYASPSSSTYVYTYDEGTLILDIVKPEGRQLIWRGAARDEVRFSSNPGKESGQLNEAVSRLLKDFPPS
jgi:hypothetical protein